jgi:hypothetical protein
MDEIAQIVRDIGQQQGENVYLRACYAILKRLQELTEQTSDDLDRLHQASFVDSPEEAFRPVYHTVCELQTSVFALIDQACNAESACEELCPAKPSLAAHHVFETVRNMQSNR